MPAGSPGAKFLEEQVEFLVSNKTDELIDAHYHPDAVLVSFDKVVRGHEALKRHFREYMATLGRLTLVSTDRFVETEDAIFFEATVDTNLGRAHVYDALVLCGDKISHHFTGVK